MSFEFDIDNLEEKTESKGQTVCKCKKCGGDILELKYFFACSNYCGVKIWKEFLYKQLSQEEIKGLLDGKEVYLTQLKSKDGKVFNAYAFYDFDQCKIILRFENNKQGKDNKQNKQDSKSKQKKSKK